MFLQSFWFTKIAGRIKSFIQRPHSLDGTSRSVYVSYWNQPGDLKDDGQEYDKTGKEVLTHRRIDSLIALDSDENLQKEFKEQSQYLEGLYTIFTYIILLFKENNKQK